MKELRKSRRNLSCSENGNVHQYRFDLSSACPDQIQYWRFILENFSREKKSKNFEAELRVLRIHVSRARFSMFSKYSIFKHLVFFGLDFDNRGYPTTLQL